MKFKSEVLTQASGSIGGTTYSHNRGGMYRRARAIPTNPNTTRQQTVRVNFANAVTAWSTVLTAANRTSWETYAANTPVTDTLGDPLFLTGQQMFIRTATAGALAGATPGSVYTSAPTTFDFGNVGGISVTSVTAATGIILQAIAGAPEWAANDDAAMLVFVGLPQAPSVNFYKGPFRFVGFTAGDNMTPVVSSSLDINTLAGTGYVPIAGQKSFVRTAVLQGDGRYSGASIFGVIAV